MARRYLINGEPELDKLVSKLNQGKVVEEILLEGVLNSDIRHEITGDKVRLISIESNKCLLELNMEDIKSLEQICWVAIRLHEEDSVLV